MSVLDQILERKRKEIERRRRRGLDPAFRHPIAASRFLRSREQLPHVIAEVKFKSPSAGEIRSRSLGKPSEIGVAYQRGGAAAVSVLADREGFGGGPLIVRQVARAIELPVLFKEFVLDPIQMDLAVRVGASMVLLLVRALSRRELQALVDTAHDRGLLPVVEAADEKELEVALETGASIVGVNARDLATFHVDLEKAARAMELIPEERVGVLMSGVRTLEDFRAASDSAADAILIGEGLMRAEQPARLLQEWLSTARHSG